MKIKILLWMIVLIALSSFASAWYNNTLDCMRNITNAPYYDITYYINGTSGFEGNFERYNPTSCGSGGMVSINYQCINHSDYKIVCNDTTEIIWADSQVSSYFSFNEDAREDVNQINNGTPVNSPIHKTAGKIGGSYDFSGATNKYINFPDAISSVMGGSNTYSVSIWVNTSNVETENFVQSMGDGTDNQWKFISGDLKINMESEGASLQFMTIDDVSTNTWYHIIGTFSNTAGAKAYLNGLLNKSDSTVGADYDRNSDNVVGIRNSDKTLGLFGYADEFIIFDDVLTAQEVKLIYDNTKDGFNVSTLGVETQYVDPAPTLTSNISSYTKTNKAFNVLLTITNNNESTTSCTIISENTNATCSTDNSVTLTENSTTIVCTPIDNTEVNISFTPSCNSSSYEYNATVGYVFLDTLPPIITVTYPLADGTTRLKNNTAFTFDILIQDNNTFGFEINCSNSGGIDVFNYNEENINNDSYTFNNITTIEEVGLITCIVNVSDDHTNKLFKAPNDITNDRWFFGLIPIDQRKLNKIEGYIGEIDFTIHKDLIPTLQTEIKHKTDRYSLEFDFNNPHQDLVEIPIQIYCPYTLYKRNTNSEYKEHYVCSDGFSGYWIDGNTEDDEDIVTSYIESNSIIYTYKTRNSRLIMNSIGGLNYNSTTFNFTVDYWENVTFTGFNAWNLTTVNTFSVNLTNSTATTQYDTTTGNISVNLYNNTYTLLAFSDFYDYNLLANSYVTGDNASTYNISFYQAQLTVMVNNTLLGGLVTSPQIIINDTTNDNLTTPTTGREVYYLNNNTYYWLNISKTGYNANNTNYNITASGLFSTTVLLEPIANGYFYIYNEEDDVLISTTTFRIDIYNENNDDVFTNTTTTGIAYFDGISAGYYRIVLSATGGDYEDRIRYINMSIAGVTHNTSIFTINSSLTGLKAVLLHVNDEAYEEIENANIKVYQEDRTTGIFNLLSETYTNINGQSYITLATDIYFYKFTITYQGEKCYETTTPFTITAVDSDIYFTCIVGEDFIAFRDLIDGIVGTLSFTNTSNTTGYFSLDASATNTTQFCLYVYERSAIENNLLNSTCTNGTSFITTLNVDASAETSSITYVGVVEATDYDENTIKALATEYYTFIIEVIPDFSMMGLLVVLIIAVLGFFAFIKTPQIAIIWVGATLFIGSWTPLIDIPTMGSSTKLASGGLLALCILIAVIISKRTGE